MQTAWILIESSNSGWYFMQTTISGEMGGWLNFFFAKYPSVIKHGIWTTKYLVLSDIAQVILNPIILKP